MRIMRTGLVIAGLAIALAACSGGAAGGTGGTIEGPTWRLSTIGAGDGATAVPADVFADARFAGGTVAGSGGCNTFTGPATVDGAKLTVGALAATQMACGDPASAVETAYLAALAKSATFTATADALTIFDSAGATLLVFAAGPANPLVGEWIVTSYNNGAGAVVSPLEGTTLTATFTADEVSGDAGCNTYNGGYTLDAGKAAIGPLASTMKACDQPVMDQEVAFLTALQVPSTVESTGGTVTLRDAGGAMQVILAPAK